MNISDEIYVFEKYVDASKHAFANSVVTEDDKDSYNRINQSLIAAAEFAIKNSPEPENYKLLKSKFHRNGGVQGHRPVDLWVTITNKDSGVFEGFPQTYIIASRFGLEIGFAVSIHEDDYYNQEIKKRNRPIVRALGRKLPEVNSPEAREFSEILSAQQGWHYNTKSRRYGKSEFANFIELLRYLRSGESSHKGGGAIVKQFSIKNISETEIDLNSVLSETLNIFHPLMRQLLPTSSITKFISVQEALDSIHEGTDYSPSNQKDGKDRVLRSIALRQGQKKFRDAILKAYKGRCAVTGCNVESILEAAHIQPYRGVETNHVQNGILLRADIHTLFDLGLIDISPEACEVIISQELVDSEYAYLSGKKIYLPDNLKDRPSKDALEMRLAKVW